MKSRLFLLAALCLAAQLISVPLLAQSGNYRPPYKNEGRPSDSARWLNHGSKNVNHWLKGTSKKINKGLTKTVKTVNQTVQGKK